MPLPETYARIAVSGPLRRTFTYRLPNNIPSPEPGQRLLVPFGRTRKVGFYLEPAEPPPGISIKNIEKVLDKRSYLDANLFRLCLWMADYYFANPADCLLSALPTALRIGKTAQFAWTATIPDYLPPSVSKPAAPGKNLSAVALQRIQKMALLERLVKEGAIEEHWPSSPLENKRRTRGFTAIGTCNWAEYFGSGKFRPELFDGIRTRPELIAAGWTNYRIRKACADGILEIVQSSGDDSILDFIPPRTDVGDLTPNGEQQAAIDRLSKELNGTFSVTLLHGVTGSGKTLVYCHLCRKVLSQNRTALVLTPEIALAGTTLSYLRGFFGDDVTVLHSSMTDRERLESWRGIQQGKYRIVVGPRSAIFAPLPNLGVIIVDEEHDGSYKQDNPSPRFHGRDSAIMRAKIESVPIVLGSASPSLESYYAASQGRYNLIQLTQRPAGATLPDVRVVDMKDQRIRGTHDYLSYPMKKEVEIRLDAGDQVILYLNRRGHSPVLKCSNCGYTPSCPHCQVKLTYHKAGRKLSCHYCGHVVINYDACPQCQSPDFLYLGVGTQKIEENLPILLEKAEIARFDSDSTAGRKNAHTILTDFREKKNNLLLGTQMVTKGLDLPDVTLVGVLSADAALDMPDFRASEKAFARLLQVAGRSGRAGKKGEVLIQTFYPDSSVIGHAAKQDFKSFYQEELPSRQALRYPPFARLINFVLTAKDEKTLEETALRFRDNLKDRIGKSDVQAEFLGPAACPMYYLREHYRRCLLIKTRQVLKLGELLTAWDYSKPRFGLPSTVKITVDIDPDDMM